MNLCCPHTRTRLFNWITILLLTGWIGLVTLVAELAPPGSEAVVADEIFVNDLVN